MERVQLFHDHFQNYKVYGIPKAQLIIADIPYNVGINAYGSNPSMNILCTHEPKARGIPQSLFEGQ
jgi:site-specific DNA-methyltransferase (adenine-specific)